MGETTSTNEIEILDMNETKADGTERNQAEKCACKNCGCVGMRMPDSSGEYAFDDIGSATICVEESGDCVVHLFGVEDV